MQSYDDMYEIIQAVAKKVQCTPEHNSSHAFVIEVTGAMGMALHHTERTLYVHEAEFGFMLPWLYVTD